MCLYPKLIQNPKYKPNKKNGGKPPFPTDPRVTYVAIGCGKCIECMRKRAREWQIRLLEEVKQNKNAYFITLTFSDTALKELQQLTKETGYQKDNQIATIAMRRFLERWRKTHKKSLRHWFTTELGQNATERIHMHGIIWFENKEDIMKLDQYWQYGITWKGNAKTIQNKIIEYENYVNEKTIAYIIKYTTKTDAKHPKYKPIILTSPGMGNKYTQTQQGKKHQYNNEKTQLTYRTQTGHKIALPIYYKNKLYNDEQKEQLWLYQLDKQERWILGQKIDISQNYDNYLTTLRTARYQNKRLGYANDDKLYNQEEYNEKIRQIQETTKKKAFGRK